MFKYFRWYDYAFLGVISIYLLFLGMQMPLIYDEAYNLQVPLTLLNEQRYDTIYHVRSFDGLTTITTGPIVLIPVFWVFKFLSVGVLQARLVQFIYIVALIVLLWSQFVKNYNRFIGLALLLILYSTPEFDLTLTVLGELPALLFIFLGMVLLENGSVKHKTIGILVMGFSVLTKLYFLLVLFPLLAFITNKALQEKVPIRDLIKRLLITSTLFLLPLIFAETVKFAILGFEAYKAYIAELIQFLDIQQTDFGTMFTSKILFTPVDKFSAFSKGLFPGFPIWITLALTVSVIAIGIFRIDQDIKEARVVFSLSFMIFVTYLIWFLFVDSAARWRHIFPFSILFLFVLGDFVYRLVKFFKRPVPKYIIVLGLCMLFGLLILPFVVDQYKNTQTFSNKLHAQREFVTVVNSYLEEGYEIGVDGWWQAPEIAFLTGGARFLPFNCQEEHHEKYLVIYTALEEELVPDQARVFKACLGRKLFENSDKTFLLYEPIE